MPRAPQSTRPLVEGRHSIDVRRWHRDGLLCPYQPFTWTWSRGGEPTASIRVAPEPDAGWHRDGLLCPYQPFTWTWSRGGEPTASIRVAPEPDAVLLEFEWRRRGAGQWMRAYQRVPVVWTGCHFGGARPWFLCTEEAGEGKCCGRRVAELYAGDDSHLFACRSCRGLAYQSQSESPRYRAISKSQKIRKRLGGRPSLVDPFPEKPRGMHRRTYWRLFNKAEVAQERSTSLERGYLRRHFPGVLRE